MNDLTIPRDLLEQAADEAGADIEIRSDYSGRGMFGAECLGITSHSASHVYATLARLAVLTCLDGEDGLVADDVIQMIRDACQDSMGLDVIVYFPGVTTDGEDEEE